MIRAEETPIHPTHATTAATCGRQQLTVRGLAAIACRNRRHWSALHLFADVGTAADGVRLCTVSKKELSFEASTCSIAGDIALAMPLRCIGSPSFSDAVSSLCRTVRMWVFNILCGPLGSDTMCQSKPCWPQNELQIPKKMHRVPQLGSLSPSAHLLAGARESNPAPDMRYQPGRDTSG